MVDAFGNAGLPVAGAHPVDGDEAAAAAGSSDGPDAVTMEVIPLPATPAPDMSAPSVTVLAFDDAVTGAERP